MSPTDTDRTAVDELTAQLRTTCKTTLEAMSYIIGDTDNERTRTTLENAAEVTAMFARNYLARAVDLGADDADLTEALTRMHAVNRAVHDLHTALG